MRIEMSRVIRVAAATLIAASAGGASQAVAQTAVQPCSNVAYRGFDSRLIVEAVSRVPIGSDQVTGFEVSNGRPIVAFERRLVGIDGDRQAALPSIDRIDALAVDATGRLFVQQGSRLRRVASDKLETVRAVAAGTRLHNSGQALFVESESSGTASRLTVRTVDDRGALPPFHFDGAGATVVSWNSVGLAAVAGDSLFAWVPGAKQMTRLRTDKGLKEARDVVLIARDAAVVALPHALVVVTARGSTVLALARARLGWTGAELFVLDESFGVIWKLTGVERLGSAAGDRQFASALMKGVVAENDVRFLEAARLMGCEGARALRRR
jgi:hypothetical protein